MIPLYTVRASRAAATFASSSCAPFHTSAVQCVESARKRQARLTRQKNIAKREELQKKAASSRPHVVLGTIAGTDDAKWAICDLARVLVRPEELAPDAPSQRVASPAAPVAADAVHMLFEHLPLLAADMDTRREMNALLSVNVEDMAAHHETELAAGVAQANVLAKVVDLRNANAAGIAFENRRRVIAAFSEPGKPNDTGRTEVQGAMSVLLVTSQGKEPQPSYPLPLP
ncbi:hypothetical protein BJV74DRAFT_856661 [Russula compacta]|nr:hypothetical protein BJV74DRAFT_856661 [Russula compacta]